MANIWALPPQPETKLGRHRQLAPLAGIHVSPICLGAMSIGDKWATLGMGQMDKESSFKLLDAFYNAGGNFIDTANNYQDESSEAFIGEWMELRRVRDQMVIATKVSRTDSGYSAVTYYGIVFYRDRVYRTGECVYDSDSCGTEGFLFAHLSSFSTPPVLKGFF